MKKPPTASQKTLTISFWHPASLICTVFGVGKIPFASGTWGSLVGYIIFYYLSSVCMYLSHKLGLTNTLEEAFYSIFMIPVILFFIGWWLSNIYESKSGKHDSKEIVIDEVVGVMISMYLCYIILEYFYIDIGLNYSELAFIIVTFLTFRFFDIVKRGPVGWIDRNVNGGLGVMLDDVVAGILAGITSALIFYLVAII